MGPGVFIYFFFPLFLLSDSGFLGLIVQACLVRVCGSLCVLEIISS